MQNEGLVHETTAAAVGGGAPGATVRGADHEVPL
jgi:hypothetical protein